MALRDTLWITDTHALRTDYQRTQDVVAVFGDTWRRSRTIVTDEWILLTEAAAIAYADTHAGDTNTTHRVTEDNRIIGSYKLTRNVDSSGSFVKDT